MSGYGSTGLLSEETEALRAKLSKRAEAASSNYSAVVNFLQYIYLACGYELLEDLMKVFSS